MLITSTALPAHNEQGTSNVRSNTPIETSDGLPDSPDFGVMTLEQLESTIQDNMRAFVEVGLALREIRDRAMFKPKFSRFEDYCRAVWGFCRQSAHRAIQGSQIALDLSPIGDIGEAILHESQIRPLAKLPNTQLRREAFVMAVKGSATGQPTASQVNAAVHEMLLREQVRAAQAVDGKPIKVTDERARVIHGDTMDAGLIIPQSVHFVLGSPPYNIGAKYPSVDDALKPEDYLAKMRAWLASCHSWLIPEGGRLALNLPMDTRKFGPFPIAAEATRIARDVGFFYEATVVWDEASHKGYLNEVDPVAVPQIFCRCEVVLIFSKGGIKRTGTTQMPDVRREEVVAWSSGYWNFAGAHGNKGHPCPFPAELPQRLIKLLSYPGDTVLDPWCGSGTTLVQALKLGRHAVGIDIEEKYCRLAELALAQISESTVGV